MYGYNWGGNTVFKDLIVILNYIENMLPYEELDLMSLGYGKGQFYILGKKATLKEWV